MIRPKRIHNFCLLHATFGSYCYDIHTLPYNFDHIWTNLLTQCTPVPVSVFCCFCISGFSITKTVRKIPEKYIYNQHSGPFQAPEVQPEGATRGRGALVARPPPWPRRGGAW